MLKREAGVRMRPSEPEMRKSHSSEGEETPPGRRQAMPQMAMGSKGEEGFLGTPFCCSGWLLVPLLRLPFTWPLVPFV